METILSVGNEARLALLRRLERLREMPAAGHAEGTMALRSGPPGEAIETVRGVGYRLWASV